MAVSDAAGQTASGGPTDDNGRDPFASLAEQGVRLNLAFVSIKDVAVRESIVAFVIQAANRESKASARLA